jgi:hypothetical protein
VRIFLWLEAGVNRQASVDLLKIRCQPVHTVEQVCQLLLNLAALQMGLGEPHT